jgi:hypothetical protein
MKWNQIAVAVVASAFVGVAILLSADVGIPSETMVPVLIAVLLAVRVQRRRNTVA